MLAPSRIGRFIVLRELGAGGMGVVYAAYDEELDRRVAIKVLSDDYPGAVERGTSRMYREAQALARLSHPNVVQVYEVGPVEGGIYIAMELVRGRTLREWLTEKPRSWRDVVAVFLQVGAGLQAAHEGGIVHRDVKPDNILVGDDGRARVLDFSLAAPLDRQVEIAAAGDVRASDSLVLTQAGAFVGTPAYMSPEQYLGRTIDARSDQFSFCVTLWESLYGERPFPGDTLEAVRSALLRGKPAQPPHDRVPAALRRAVERGLRLAADDRFPDLAALLAALARDPYRVHRWIAATVAVLALAGGAAALAETASDAIDCQQAAARLGDVYSPADRDALLAALARSPVPYVRAGAAALTAELDEYAARWARTAEQACAATHLRHEASSELLDRRGGCLNDRLAELDALLGVLAGDGAGERALAAARDLVPPEQCLQPGAAGSRGAAGPAADALRARLAAVRAQLAAGDDARALALASSAMSEATGLSDPVLEDESHYWRGRAALALLELPGAAGDLHAAYHGGARRGDDGLAFRAALALAEVSARKAELAVADEWLDHAEDAIRRGQLGELEQARLELRRGESRGDAGHPAEALPPLDRALATLERARGRDALELARVHLLRGIALRDLGRTDEALAAFARSEEILRAATGPDHPGVVVPLNNRAAALLDRGRPEDALALFERGLQIRLRAYGRDHPRTAFSLSQIGEALVDLERWPEAERALSSALAIRERTLGPDHPDVAETLTGLGNLSNKTGRYDPARRHLDRALQIRRKTYGDDHDVVASAHLNLSIAERHAGRLDDAALHLQRAEAIWSAALPSDHPKRIDLALERGRLARRRGEPAAAALEFQSAVTLGEARGEPQLRLALRELADAELARGRRVPALAALERAAALAHADPTVAARELATVRFALAQALWPDDPVRSRSEATAAARALPDGRSVQLRREIEAWLADR